VTFINQDEELEADDLAAPRGCAFAFGIVIPIWAIVILIINLMR
jgi:hypothetical protein